MPQRLSSEQENALVADAKSGDLDAQQQLLLLHEPFLRHVAGRFASRSSQLDFDDLLMAARYGLLHAVTKFDPDRVSPRTGKRSKFITYAGHWVYQYVRVEVSKGSLIWVPAYQRGKRDRIKHYHEHAERAQHVLSMAVIGNAWGRHDDWGPEARDDQRPYDGDDIGMLREALGILEAIDQRSHGIIGDRYFRGMTLSQISGRMNVTKEAVRQMQAKAIKRLRQVWQEVSDRRCAGAIA
jgi:RNA polymerase sigma factor (sigma-70 family)